MSNILNDLNLDGLGLLMFLICNKDKNDNISLSNREIARRITKSESWVRTKIKLFTKANIISAKENAKENARKKASNVQNIRHLHVLYSLTKNAKENASKNAEKDDVFEEIWKEYGRIGSKKIAKSRYEKLSNNKKDLLRKSIPYYRAFCSPGYYVYLEKYISNEYWNRVEVFEGVPIPKDRYRIADVDRFLEWFNKKVAGSGIPQISELTPQRRRMLNICYTLCEEEMKKVMNILLNNEKYVEMASKGMIDFDYIFKPVNLRRICEKGESDD